MTDETRGKELRDRREALGRTQQEIAQLTGLSVETVRNAERGRAGKGSMRIVREALARLESGAPGAGHASVTPITNDARIIAEALGSARVADFRVRIIGRRGGVRYVTLVARDDDISDQELQQAIEDLHRQHGDDDLG